MAHLPKSAEDQGETQERKGITQSCGWGWQDEPEMAIGPQLPTAPTAQATRVPGRSAGSPACVWGYSRAPSGQCPGTDSD